jgi:hypothetical protein
LSKVDLKREVLGVILALVIAGSLGAGYLIGHDRGTYTTVPTTMTITMLSTATSTVISTSTTTTTSLIPPPAGIILVASVNHTRLITGEKVAITAILFNTSDQKNNISVSYNFPFYGLGMWNENWPACWGSPFELIVLKGNFSSAALRAMGPGGVPGVTCYGGKGFTHFVFDPDGEYLNQYAGTDLLSYSGPVTASVTVTTNGYWDNGSRPTYPSSYCTTSGCGFLAAAHSFMLGVYTVAVADEWGQIDVVHIAVVV